MSNDTMVKLQKLPTDWNFLQLLVKHQQEDQGNSTIVDNKWAAFPNQWSRSEFEIEKCSYDTVNVLRREDCEHHVFTRQSPTKEWLNERPWW